MRLSLGLAEHLSTRSKRDGRNPKSRGVDRRARTACSVRIPLCLRKRTSFSTIVSFDSAICASRSALHLMWRNGLNVNDGGIPIAPSPTLKPQFWCLTTCSVSYERVLGSRLKNHVCPSPRLIVDPAPFVSFADNLGASRIFHRRGWRIRASPRDVRSILSVIPEMVLDGYRANIETK